MHNPELNWEHSTAEGLVPLIEALLLTHAEPLTWAALVRMVGSETPQTAIERALVQLERQYQTHPFIQMKLGGLPQERHWQLVANARLAPYLARSEAPKTGRYSRAVLETLALIAWRQPITRAEIEAVRGVAVNAPIIRLLTERGWIRVVGVKDSPGKPELLGTTPQFLQDFGLESLTQLPAFESFVGQGALDV
ncbi:MAG: SMC-Scp complex subunit ScpB [Halothiobacillus sp. 24-54-40]|jgi:segregation and condensation protein B|nr:MAG: SMC-Scp complex subunit ScpB [Halothiobacillus sp. 35-54-62]OYZ87325.1 MAG: SMC-Scp complex subunit ScpB [Halothiobacillus sp. 24-54-40]OZA80484.1 MAG: SMC-Scp complex subunit ScpB [Halothiobacillus sp. 39-53-45]HQS02393.1 SMC-Scp complex subunit ScpB [Halothiobacillus sp.]HQS29303.1 SMC-Scp complex subunit ScpB [Halothiobacillus sp.]